jgi:ATP-binding cassette subfamily C protein
MESIKFLKNKKTLIVITHRLATVSNCDKIYFIDNGRVIKKGTPEKILNNI